MSQTQAILRALQKRPLTAIDALKLCNCFRLAARVKDLRNDGHNIVTETITQKGKHFAQYRLVQKRGAA